MSSDDKSKKDEQNNSTQKQDPESKPVVYLFPEHSVYDMAPIVVPDNMRLGADAGDDRSEDTDEHAEAEQTEIDNKVSNEGATETETVTAETDSAQSDPPVNRAKIQAQKIKATSEQAKLAHDQIDKNRDEQSRDAQSRVDMARAQLDAAKGTPNEGQPWSEHANAVLEHFGWVEAGWGPPGKAKQDNVEPTASVQQQPESDKEESIAKESGSSADDDDKIKYLFPENSVYDLEPIVVPESLKLGPTVQREDPRKTAQNQKLSPIKFNKNRKGKQASDKWKSARTGSLAEAGQKLGERQLQELANKTDEVPIVEITLTQQPGHATQEVEPTQQPAAGAEAETIEAQQEPTEKQDNKPKGEDLFSDLEEPPTSETKSENRERREGWEEKTGWEEVVEKQERWQEDTGWDEAVAGKGNWEGSGWSDSDNESSVELKSEPDTTNGASSAAAEVQSADTKVEEVDASSDAPVKRLQTVETLFGGDDDEQDLESSSSEEEKHAEPVARAEVQSEQPLPVEEQPAADIGTETLELEPTDRQALEQQIDTTGSESQTGEIRAEAENKGPVAEQPATEDSHSSESTEVAPDAVPPKEPPSEERSRGFDVSSIGIETADIDQIILEHNEIQLTIRPGGEFEDEEERHMRELILKEQAQEQTELVAKSQEQSEEKAGEPQTTGQVLPGWGEQPEPPAQSPSEAPADASVDTSVPPAAQETSGAGDEAQVYDEEDDVLQDFRPTDSIYELAPFVLPQTQERLTPIDPNVDPSAASAGPPIPRTVKAIVRTSELPERAAIPAVSNDPLVGTVLAHSYEILDVIGQGGMAIVYRAKQIATGRLVAIKTLRSPNPPDLMRFGQEIKTHSHLDHKNIVGYIDSINERGQLFLVMERVRGISLQEIIRMLGKMDDPEIIVDILSQILDALDYAHRGGLIHRDLKTGNIILIKEEEEDMVVKILDFGIAKIQGDLQRLTHVGQALGSPIYMSPEQCSGKLLTTRSDLYSLGVVAYETVTGTPPYSKGTLINVMAAHCNENIKPKPLSEMASHLPKYKMLDQIFQKALQTHPDKRWQSAVEFRTALQFWLKSIQIDALYDELPVELLRCPVTEFDMDRLIASAADAPMPSVRITQPNFSWVPQQSQEITNPPDAGEAWSEAPEEGGWADGQAKPQQSIPGWGEEPAAQESAPAAQDGSEPWGASEKNRQATTSDLWNAKQPPATPPVQEVQETMAEPAEPETPTPQQLSQAETGDMWNAQQQMQARRDRPVRNLLSSPEDVRIPAQPFEVQTSTDMNALGSELPKLTADEKQELRAMNATGSLQVAFADPESRTTGGDIVDQGETVVDLRRRQTPEKPPTQSQSLLTTVLISAVVVVLTILLFVYYWVQNPDDVKAKFDAAQSYVESLSGKKTEHTTPEAPEVSPGPTVNEQNEQPSSGLDTGPQSRPETAPPSSDEKIDDATSETSTYEKPTTTDSTNSDDINTGVKKPDDGEPIPFKKGEPEEGVDF